MTVEPPGLPERPDAAQAPRVGVDEWVASHEERRERAGRLREAALRVPPWGWLALFAVPAATLPLLTSSDYVVRVGVNTLLFALLALGLNVVVGYAGLLDLGYIAFYGFGAYMYAFLSSEQFGLHWPTELTIPLVIAASAVLGLLLGLPSRRLLGDYLAIVTLFFAQIFVVLTTNANAITLPWNDRPSDITGGPNGIADIDQMSILGIELDSIERYFWLSLVVFVLVIGGLHLLSESRTGRAWRALREDPLAAEAMTIPVNRLKLLAFAFGAGTAGLTGTLFAAVQVGVFPQNFDLPLLITVYAMVILGGAGSLPGVVIGAAVITITLEVLRDPEQARWLFYGVILLSLGAFVRPWWRLAVLVGAVAVAGLATRIVVEQFWDRGAGGESAGGDVISRAVEAWVVLPSNPRLVANIAFVVLIAGVLLLTLLRGWWRFAGMVPVLYLAAFVWENRLVTEPSVTRLLLLGGLLIALMTARPQGLLGTSRVEIV